MPIVALESFVSRLKLPRFTFFERETWLADAILIVGIAGIPFILVIGNGNFVFASVFLILLSILFFSFHRLAWGLNILIGLVLIADSYDIPGFRPFTYTIYYLQTLNVAMKNLIHVDPGWGVLTPFELHALIILFIWVILGVLKKDFEIRRMPNRKVTLLFVASLLFSIAYGNLKGGDLLMSLWEVRALPFLVIMSWIVLQFLRTKDQVYSLMWVVIWLISFKAVQAIERFGELGFVFEGFRTLANHEDAVFIVTLFIFWIALFLNGSKNSQRRWLSVLSIPLLMGFYVANRRATYASFIVSLVAVFLLMKESQQRRMAKVAGVVIVLFSIYVAAYWNSYGRLAVVAQGVKSTLLSHDREAISGEDFSSALARDQENFDLATTFRKSPVIGIGFGKEYEMVIKFYGAYALKGYIAHNEVLWILIKSGAVGYFLFFFFLNSFIFYGAKILVALRDPYLRTVCIVSVVAIVNQIVVSHVDMQLTYTRNMCYLGTLIGLIPAIERIDRELQTAGGASQRSEANSSAEGVAGL